MLPRFMLALAIVGVPAIAHAEDVAVLSQQDAAAILADPAEPPCPRPLGDGSCDTAPATRSFRLVAPQSRSRQSAAAGVAPVTSTPAATTSAVTPRTSYGRSRTSSQPAAGTARRQPAGREVPLQFEAGSARLSAQSQANLKTLAAALLSPGNAAKRIRITGHTDQSGGAATNRALSEHRAAAAADYLATQGVDRNRVEAVGRGFDNPLTGLSTYDPRQRRVEVERLDR